MGWGRNRDCDGKGKDGVTKRPVPLPIYMHNRSDRRQGYSESATYLA